MFGVAIKGENATKFYQVMPLRLMKVFFIGEGASWRDLL